MKQVQQALCNRLCKSFYFFLEKKKIFCQKKPNYINIHISDVAENISFCWEWPFPCTIQMDVCVCEPDPRPTKCFLWSIIYSFSKAVSTEAGKSGQSNTILNWFKNPRKAPETPTSRFSTYPKLFLYIYTLPNSLQQEQGDLTWGWQHWIKINMAIKNLNFKCFYFFKEWKEEQKKKYFNSPFTSQKRAKAQFRRNIIL